MDTNPISELTEAESEAVNEWLDDIVAELDHIVWNYGEYVRPTEASNVFKVSFAYALSAVDNVGPEMVREPLDMFLGDPENGDIISSLSPKTFGNLLLQYLGDQLDKPLDKHVAVDIADTIGPDHAQKLYRLAVLVTKLA